MNHSISVPEWHKMAQQGDAPPVRIQLNGSSMEPLIRIRQDYVTIVHMEGFPGIGDIVLFSDPEKEARYVVHRVWKTKKGKVLTWGDNCPKPDGWISEDYIWGKVVLIERGKRTIKPHPQTGMILAFFWHQAMKVYRIRERIKKKLGYKNTQ